MTANVFSSLKSTDIDLPGDAWTPRVTMFYSIFFNGTLQISGWVRNSSGTPRQRRMVLHEYPSMLPIAFCLSDPAEGGNNYFFNNLIAPRPGETYVVTVHSIDLSTPARIKDNLTPV